MRKILWGLFFIIMAGLLIAGQVMEIPSALSIALTLFVSAVLIESIIAKNRFAILFNIAILIVINKEILMLENISSFSIIVASFLISIGLHIIFGNKKKEFKSEVSYVESDIITINTSFGSTIKYINSEDFKKAFISCNFAGAQVYFDNAIIVGDQAEIEFDVSFSGVELYIPKNWKIINKVNVSLGGLEERTRNFETNKTVILTGKVNLAGIEIKYV